MADVEQWSAAAGLGGLRPLVIDRYVATRAALQALDGNGGVASARDVEDHVRYFLPWLKEAGDLPDKELRRSLLLTFTDNIAGNPIGTKPEKIVKAVKELYGDIA